MTRRKRKLFLGLLILALLLQLSPAINALEQNENPRNIILIGWDGAGRKNIKEALSRGELPNLKQLSSEGNLVAIDILRETDTKAGWAEILTGYEPEITGVFDNCHYQPIPKGYTIFERLENFFGPDNFVTVAVIGKKENVDAGPPIKQLAKIKPAWKCKAITTIENNTKFYIVQGKPYYYTKESLDVFINGLMENEKVGIKTLALLEKYKDKPFLFFIHFAETDKKGHRYGQNSKEYNDALISADFWTGEIVEKLKELNLYDQTLIYVTSDHGFDEGRGKRHAPPPHLFLHENAPYVFLATNDPKVMRRGERKDIAPTIVERFGLNLDTLEPPLDGHSLTRPYEAPVW